MSEYIELDGEKYPAAYEVCPRCNGTGKHVNPAIDGNGITAADRDDWADDDFMEDYIAGVYDVACYVCGGKRVVLELDADRCTPEQIAAYYDWQQEEADYRAICEAERRMGA